MVHELIEAYDLTKHLDCRSSEPASVEDLLTFHSSEYIKRLSTGKSYAELSDTENSSDMNRTDEEMFGLGKKLAA